METVVAIWKKACCTHEIQHPTYTILSPDTGGVTIMYDTSFDSIVGLI